jgi:hypothetical protein
MDPVLISKKCQKKRNPSITLQTSIQGKWKKSTEFERVIIAGVRRKAKWGTSYRIKPKRPIFILT